VAPGGSLQRTDKVLGRDRPRAEGIPALPRPCAEAAGVPPLNSFVRRQGDNAVMPLRVVLDLPEEIFFNVTNTARGQIRRNDAGPQIPCLPLPRPRTSGQEIPTVTASIWHSWRRHLSHLHRS
jgi:hypothetical protein